MRDVFLVYQALWRHAEKLGARVVYDGTTDDSEGWFHPNPYDHPKPHPTITIGRRFYEEIDQPSRDRNLGGRNEEGLLAPDLLRETATLAHEFGHFLSWKDRTPRAEWDAYYVAVRLRDEAWRGVPREDDNTVYNNLLRASVRAALTLAHMESIVTEEQRKPLTDSMSVGERLAL